MEAAEKGLRRLEGVVSAKAQGFRSPEKFFYDLAVKESAAVTPAAVMAHVKKQFGDYEYMDMTYKGLAGTAEKTADGYAFTARGSKQKFALKAGGGLEKLVAEGKTQLTLAGKAVQSEKGGPLIEVTEAVETKK